MADGVLRDIGLTDREIRVYKSLLRIGETTTGPLIDDSGVPGSKIYQTLQKLEDKGLASHIKKDGAKHYAAKSPDQLLALERRRLNDVEDAVEELHELSERDRPDHSVEYIEGKTAVRNLFRAILREQQGSSFYGYSTGANYSEGRASFYDWLGEKKDAFNIDDHLLISENHRDEFEAHYDEKALQKIRDKTKYVEKSFPQDTGISPPHIILPSWKPTLAAIHIRNQLLAEQYKEFFRVF